MFTATILPNKLLHLQQQLRQQPIPNNAWVIMQEYLACFSMGDVQQELWLLLAGSLTNDELPLQTGMQRHNLIFFCEFTLLFMEAATALGIHEQKWVGKQTIA